jgi:hypothetical protein
MKATITNRKRNEERDPEGKKIVLSKQQQKFATDYPGNRSNKKNTDNKTNHRYYRKNNQTTD